MASHQNDAGISSGAGTVEAIAETLEAGFLLQGLSLKGKLLQGLKDLKDLVTVVADQWFVIWQSMSTYTHTNCSSGAGGPSSRYKQSLPIAQGH